jgi:hypothetical protein
LSENEELKKKVETLEKELKDARSQLLHANMMLSAGDNRSACAQKILLESLAESEEVPKLSCVLFFFSELTMSDMWYI